MHRPTPGSPFGTSGKGGDAKDPDGNRNFIVVKQSNAPLNDVEARKSLVASPFAKAENDAKPVELRDAVWPAFAPPPPRKYPALDAKSDPFQYRDTLLSVDANTVPIPIEADDAPPLTFLKDLRIDTGGFSDPNKAYPVEPNFARNFRYAAVPSAINANHGLIFAPDKTNFLRFVLPMPVPAKELPKKNPTPKKDAKGKEIPPVSVPAPAVEAKPLTPLPTHGIYDLTTGKVVGRLPGNLLLMPDSRLSPDGKLLVLNGGANLEIWKADETKPAGILPLVGVVRWADFLTPTTFATFEIAPEGALVLWDLTTLQKIKTIPLPLKPVPEGTPPIQIQEKYILNKNGAAISPGGRFVAVPTPTELIVIDVRESKEFTRIAVRQNMGIERVISLQFLSRPDRLLFSSDIEEILVWDLKTGQRDRIYAWYTPGYGTLLPSAFGTARFFDSGKPNEYAYCNGMHADVISPANPLALGEGGQNLFFVNTIGSPGMPPAMLATKTPPDGKGLIYIHPVWNYGGANGTTPYKYVTLPAFEAHEKIVERPVVPVGKPVDAVLPTPPAAWASLPPTANGKAAEAPILSVWPQTVSGKTGIHIRFDVVHKRIRQYGREIQMARVLADRYDMNTGQKVGESKILYPWCIHPTACLEDFSKSGVYEPLPKDVRLALDASSERFAIVDPAQLNRVDVFAIDGTPAGGLLVAEKDAIVEWLGWSADGKLLTLAKGILTAWNVEDSTAAWAINGTYRKPCLLVADNKWGGFCSGNRVDLIDVNAGKCLARCSAKEGPVLPLALAISPSGKNLVVVSKNAPVAGLTEDYYGLVWNLKTGSVEKFGIGDSATIQRNSLDSIVWHNDEQFFWHDIGQRLFDLEARGRTANFQMNLRIGADRPLYRTTPDNRIWTQVITSNSQDAKLTDTKWYPLVIPAKDQYLFAPDRTFSDLKKLPIQFEIDIGDKAAGQRLGNMLATQLAQRGFTIGEGGWKIRCITEISKVNEKILTGGILGNTKIMMPETRFTLFAPSGTEAVWTKAVGNDMLHGSRYVTMAGFDDVPGVGRMSKYTYDFQGKDPNRALWEEFLTKIEQNYVMPSDFPQWMILNNGKATTLPVASQVEVAGLPEAAKK